MATIKININSGDSAAKLLALKNSAEGVDVSLNRLTVASKALLPQWRQLSAYTRILAVSNASLLKSANALSSSYNKVAQAVAGNTLADKKLEAANNRVIITEKNIAAADNKVAASKQRVVAATNKAAASQNQLARSQTKSVTSTKQLGAANASLLPRVLKVTASYMLMRSALRGVIELGNSFLSFEDSMVRVGAITGATTEEFLRLNDAAKLMGETTIWTAAESAQALKILGQAGLSAADSIAALPGVLNLAMLGELDLARATEIAVGTSNAYRMGIEGITKVNDVLAMTSLNAVTTVKDLGVAMSYTAKVSDLEGISIEQTSAMLGVLADNNIKGGRAGRYLATAIVKTDKAAKYFNLGSGATFIDVLDAIAESGMSAAEAKKVFGQRAFQAAMILGQSMPAYRELNEQLKQAAGTSEELATKIEGSLLNQFKLLKSAITGVAIEAFGKYSEAIKKSIGDSIAVIAQNKDKILGVITATVDAIVGVVDGIDDLLDKIVEANDAIGKFTGVTLSWGQSAGVALGAWMAYAHPILAVMVGLAEIIPDVQKDVVLAQQGLLDVDGSLDVGTQSVNEFIAAGSGLEAYVRQNGQAISDWGESFSDLDVALDTSKAKWDGFVTSFSMGQAQDDGIGLGGIDEYMTAYAEKLNIMKRENAEWAESIRDATTSTAEADIAYAAETQRLKDLQIECVGFADGLRTLQEETDEWAESLTLVEKWTFTSTAEDFKKVLKDSKGVIDGFSIGIEAIGVASANAEKDYAKLYKLVEDTKFEKSLIGMTEYEKSVAKINKVYNEKLIIDAALAEQYRATAIAMLNEKKAIEETSQAMTVSKKELDDFAGSFKDLEKDLKKMAATERDLNDQIADEVFKKSVSGLNDYDKAVAQINYDIDKFIAKNPGLAETANKLRDIQIANVDTVDVMKNVWESFDESLEGVLSGTFSGEFESIGDMFSDLLDSMYSMFINWASKVAAEQIVFSISGGSGGVDTIGSMFSGSSSGTSSISNLSSLFSGAKTGYQVYSGAETSSGIFASTYPTISADGYAAGSGMTSAGSSVGGGGISSSVGLAGVIALVAAAEHYTSSINQSKGYSDKWINGEQVQIGDLFSGSPFNDPFTEFLNGSLGSGVTGQSYADAALMTGDYSEMMKGLFAGSIDNAFLGLWNPVSSLLGFDDKPDKMRLWSDVQLGYGEDGAYGYGFDQDGVQTDKGMDWIGTYITGRGPDDDVVPSLQALDEAVGLYVDTFTTSINSFGEALPAELQEPYDQAMQSLIDGFGGINVELSTRDGEEWGEILNDTLAQVDQQLGDLALPTMTAFTNLTAAIDQVTPAVMEFDSALADATANYFDPLLSIDQKIIDSSDDKFTKDFKYTMYDDAASQVATYKTIYDNAVANDAGYDDVVKFGTLYTDALADFQKMTEGQGFYMSGFASDPSADVKAAYDADLTLELKGLRDDMINAGGSADDFQESVNTSLAAFADGINAGLDSLVAAIQDLHPAIEIDVAAYKVVDQVQVSATTVERAAA